tara:strand:- start:228 stop:1001 length:774 start_codon:yes stop_codon:yes gene_type:complete
MKHFLYLFFIVLSSQSFGQTDQELSLNELFKTAIIENDIPSQKKLSKELKSNYNINTINYYRTLLSGVPNNSILITNGFEDTYPITIIQITESIGVNIEVVSLKLLKEEKYINRVFDKLKINKDFDKTSPSIYLGKLLSANKKVFISSTLNPNHYGSYSNHFFVVGLSLEYKSKSQLNKLELFWADLQNKNKYKFSLSAKEKGIYSNYLPPLLTLYKLKLGSGVKDESLKLGILHIAQLVNKLTTVKSIIEQYEKGG